MLTNNRDTYAADLALLDKRVRQVDEPRWLSSRYARRADRHRLIALYALFYELARIRLVATDQTIGQIRYQWWRDTVMGCAAGRPREHDVARVLARLCAQDLLSPESLLGLIDESETAFLKGKRSARPDIMLTQMALTCLDPVTDLSDRLAQIIRQWCLLRRSEPIGEAEPYLECPVSQRPALAHLRLRHVWPKLQDMHKSQSVRQRLCIMQAVRTGWV